MSCVAKTCKKCGGHWIGINYSHELDKIVNTCKSCDYYWTEDPADKDKPGDAVKRTRGGTPPHNYKGYA